MPLHPAAQQLLAALSPPGAPGLHELPLEVGRQGLAAMVAAMPSMAEPVAGVKDRTVPGPGGEIPVRVYTPKETGGALPALVFFHGGGFVMGSLDTHDQVCRALAHHAGTAVVSVGYRLAPEHKAPAALEDCYAATRWVAENGASIGVDGSRIAVGGDSAGATLAAGVALLARDRGGPRIAFQLLAYPVIDPACATESSRAFASGYFLTLDTMRWFWSLYLGDDRKDPYVAPVYAELTGLPPALVITAEFDPLRDEGEAYAERMKSAGVPTQSRRYDGMIHGFMGLAGALPPGKEAIVAASSALGAALR